MLSILDSSVIYFKEYKHWHGIVAKIHQH